MSNDIKQARCKSCNDNDEDSPCAYPSEGKHGCLRDARMNNTGDIERVIELAKKRGAIVGVKYVMNTSSDSIIILPEELVAFEREVLRHRDAELQREEN